jgi:phosphohistidine phosphatase SixA
MRQLELRRHAAREKNADRLSPEGRTQARAVGLTLSLDYSAVFVSPARRAAETAALFLGGQGHAAPVPTVVRGLASDREDRWRVAGRAAGSSRVDAISERDPSLVAEESAALGSVVADLVTRIPDGRRGLVVGHTPLLEAAVYGLTGVLVEPLAECEGVLLTRQDDGRYVIEELRLPKEP